LGQRPEKGVKAEGQGGGPQKKILREHKRAPRANVGNPAGDAGGRRKQLPGKHKIQKGCKLPQALQAPEEQEPEPHLQRFNRRGKRREGGGISVRDATNGNPEEGHRRWRSKHVRGGRAHKEQSANQARKLVRPMNLTGIKRRDAGTETTKVKTGAGGEALGLQVTSEQTGGS